MCVSMSVRACMRACLRACVRACVRANNVSFFADRLGGKYSVGR